MRAALRSSRGCNGESHSKHVVDFDLIDRIVGVSPCHPQAKIGLAVLVQTYKQISTTFLATFNRLAQPSNLIRKHVVHACQPRAPSNRCERFEAATGAERLLFEGCQGWWTTAGYEPPIQWLIRLGSSTEQACTLRILKRTQ